MKLNKIFWVSIVIAILYEVNLYNHWIIADWTEWVGTIAFIVAVISGNIWRYTRALEGDTMAQAHLVDNIRKNKRSSKADTYILMESIKREKERKNK